MAIQRPCPEHIVCPTINGLFFPDPDSPFANLSSEAPDPVDSNFVVFYQNDPPINADSQNWGSSATGGNGVPGFFWCDYAQPAYRQYCLAEPYRTIHLQFCNDAERICYWRAYNQAVQNALERWVNNPPKASEEVNCTVICPDGTPFYHTIEAGRVLAATQGQANAQAASLCVPEAEDEKICILTDTLPSICVDHDLYFAQIIASGGTPTITGNPYFWEIESGSLPPGLSLNPTNGKIGGYPTTGGDYSFTIKITDGINNSQTKNFTIKVLEIAPASLPDGVPSTPYSQQLTLIPPTTAVWSIVSGSLPTGLSLSSTGLINGGSPTTAGSSTFTVQAVTADNVCTKTYTLTVAASLTPATWWAFENTPFTEIDSVTLEALSLLSPADYGVTAGKIGNTVVDVTGPVQVSQNSAALEYDGNGFSIACWFKGLFYNPGDTVRFEAHYSTGIREITFDFDWVVDPFGTNDINITDSVYGFLDTLTFSNALIDPLNWNFIVFTYDPADNKLRASINNNAFLTSVAIPAVAVPPPATNGITTMIEINQCVYDEVATFLKPISISDVNFLWNGGAGKTYPL